MIRGAKLVEEFEAAVRNHAWRGGGDPADLPEIDRSYKAAKQRLLAHLAKLEPHKSKLRTYKSRPKLQTPRIK